MSPAIKVGVNHQYRARSEGAYTCRPRVGDHGAAGSGTDRRRLRIEQRRIECEVRRRRRLGDVRHRWQKRLGDRENSDLSYCEYKSNQTFDRERRVAVSVTTAGELMQLASWSEPNITGIGDEAHGGDASVGLAARKGKLGLELVVDLGFRSNAAANLAAEERLARQLLPRLAG